ncbi:hypothetical protein [Lacihabitans soyangensis]|jgi:hypothetical protein|uniref:Uncharacterized protein n=1 Tax=Lacihabitans soyangensis TaxID=869394 RepID=A0AAE3H277_9BACT|nr:hypothetical protein [Lacihabitans soyangensis]MCP9763607.1 hypothetical protein [Lacihabitans soyangensis]
MNITDDFDDDDLMAPEALKEMLVSEIELIRDAMTIVNMFVGEPMLAGVKYLQEFEPKKNNTHE